MGAVGPKNDKTLIIKKLPLKCQILHVSTPKCHVQGVEQQTQDHKSNSHFRCQSPSIYHYN